jgi:hypothetical protein
MYFTVEEENFICAFNTKTREGLIAEIEAFLPSVEADIREIGESAVRRLRKMSDEAFGNYVFHQAD